MAGIIEIFGVVADLSMPLVEAHLMRRAARTDKNQSDVIQWYEGLGYSVINTSKMGDGFPDLIAVKQVAKKRNIGDPLEWRWRKVFVEVKADENAEYTPAQKRFNERYPGLVVRVENEDDVLRSVEDGI